MKEDWEIKWQALEDLCQSTKDKYDIEDAIMDAKHKILKKAMLDILRKEVENEDNRD